MCWNEFSPAQSVWSWIATRKKSPTLGRRRGYGHWANSGVWTDSLRQVNPLCVVEKRWKGKVIDTEVRSDIMTPEEVARFLRKSPSWVYKHWQELGGVKLGGSLFFPSKGELYEHIFHKGQGVAIRLQPEGRKIHPSRVQNQKGGQPGRSGQKKGGPTTTREEADPNRHWSSPDSVDSFGLGNQATSACFSS